MPLPSILRRYYRTDRLLVIGFLVIRTCSGCIADNLLYIIFSDSDFYAEYYRFYRRCSLGPNNTKIDKQLIIKKKLDNKIIETETKAVRFRK
jgi:hypothetical protein